MKSISIYSKISILIIVAIILMGIISSIIPGDWHRIPSGNSLEPPNRDHLLGTDDLGIDILAQICYGSGISMIVGFGAAFLAGFGGSILGILSGYYGGLMDKIVTGICDIMMSIPQLPIMIVLGVFFGPSLRNVILVIALMSWAGPARTVRSRILSLKHEQYIIVSKSYGASFFHLAYKHFIPTVFPIIMVNVMRIMSHAIVTEAGLSFLGLGDPTSKSWGILLNRSINFPGIYFTDFWKWWVMAPLFFLTLLILAVSTISRDFEKKFNKKN